MKRLNRKGQAAIEFTVVIIVVLFFLLFFLSLAMTLVLSDYIEYATFMAARTYKTAFSTEEFQRQYAQAVFRGYVDKVDGLAKNIELNFVQTDPQDAHTSGVVATYEVDLFYLPPFFLPIQVPSRISLQAESILGRDPTFSECLNFFNNFTRQTGLGLEGTSLVSAMDDNGC